MSRPNYWEILSDHDKVCYTSLRRQIKENVNYSFEDILQLIRNFAEKKDSGDWKRFIVCGVCWNGNILAVNTRQLKFLLNKCRSSINTSLQRLGYIVNKSLSANLWVILSPMIPFINKSISELRQWSIRTQRDRPSAQIQ